MNPIPEPSEIALTDLPRGVAARVIAVRAAEGEHALALRLMELGFIEGESLRVVAFGFPGRDPIGVRRLIARPTATLSLEAQQRRELKQKLYGD